MIYLHVLNVETEKIVSPLDTLEIKTNEMRHRNQEDIPLSPTPQAVGEEIVSEIGLSSSLADSPIAQGSPHDKRGTENRAKYFGWGLMIATAIVLLSTMFGMMT